MTAVRPARDGAIYAAVGHGHFGAKLHRSRDRGETWQETATRSGAGRSPAGSSARTTRARRGAWCARSGIGPSAANGTAAGTTIPASTPSASIRAAMGACSSAFRPAACGSPRTAARAGPCADRVCAPSTCRPSASWTRSSRTRTASSAAPPRPTRSGRNTTTESSARPTGAGVGTRSRPSHPASALPSRSTRATPRRPGSCRRSRTSCACRSTRSSSSRARATAARRSSRCARACRRSTPDQPSLKSLSWSRSALLRNLPVAVRGIWLKKTNASGSQNLAKSGSR